MRPALSILGLAILHFTECWALFMIMVSRGMDAFNHGHQSTWIDTAVGQTIKVLWFPFYPFAWGRYIDRGEIYEKTLLFGTSLLWGLVAYVAIRYSCKRRRSN